MHLTFDSSKHKVKDIKPLVAGYKVEWRSSESFSGTGFAKSELRDRGWTDGAITKFLGDCDREVKNPYYKSGPPMRIYHVNRVLKAESQKGWQDWYEGSLSKRAKLKRASYERADEARKSLLKQVNSIRLNLPSYSRDKLLQKAVNHYNDLALERGRSFISIEECNTDFLHRIAVNYLRHEFNHYEERLDRMAGYVGNKEAYVLLKSRILTLIGSNYTFLESAVQAQQERLSEDYEYG